MTREERNIKLKKLITCMKCEVSGKVCDDNCSTQYETGNMGKIIENLEAISEILEQEPIIDKIKSIVAEWKMDTWTDNCSYEYMIKIAEIIDKAESEPQKSEEWVNFADDVIPIIDETESEET